MSLEAAAQGAHMPPSSNTHEGRADQSSRWKEPISGLLSSIDDTVQHVLLSKSEQRQCGRLKDFG